MDEEIPPLGWSAGIVLKVIGVEAPEIPGKVVLEGRKKLNI